MWLLGVFEVQKIKINGKVTHTKKWFPKIDSGCAPIVLLHDSLGCVDLWRGFPQQLADQLSRTVIAYDRLGFGQSDARNELPANNFIEEEASDYFPQIKKSLSLNEYVLFGHSVGGGMAINIAANDSDCVSVVTVAAQAFVEELTINGIQNAKKAFEKPEQMKRLEKWHGEKASWVLSAWTDIWLSEAFKAWSLEPVINLVQCPVLAIHGDNDEYGSRAFPEFISARTGGDASMLIIKDCGHVPHKEKPAEVLNAIRKLLSSVS